MLNQVGWHNEVNDAGNEIWKPPSSSTIYNQSCIIYAAPQTRAKSEIGFELNQLLCKAPGPWFNSSTIALSALLLYCYCTV